MHLDLLIIELILDLESNKIIPSFIELYETVQVQIMCLKRQKREASAKGSRPQTYSPIDLIASPEKIFFIDFEEQEQIKNIKIKFIHEGLQGEDLKLHRVAFGRLDHQLLQRVQRVVFSQIGQLAELVVPAAVNSRQVPVRGQSPFL
jgi:hypothetical protein